MSTNDGDPDSVHRAGVRLTSSYLPSTEASPSGMESNPFQLSSRSHSGETSAEIPVMSTLTLRTPMSFPSPSKNMLWDDRRPALEGRPSPRPQTSISERVELPSIRQAVPEIDHRITVEQEYRSDAASFSPAAGPRDLLTAAKYVQPPRLHKRSRLSTDEDQDVESYRRTIPRESSPPGPYRPHSAIISPTSTGRPLSAISIADRETWSVPAQSSSYLSARGMPDTRSPSFKSTNSSRPDWKPTLPSLPSLTLDVDTAQDSRHRSAWCSSTTGSRRMGPHTYPQVSNSSLHMPNSSYQQPSSSSYQPPPGRLYSEPSNCYLNPQERSPFSNSHPNYSEGMSPCGSDVNELVTDDKQRKRRGNLPKETTEVLRVWFVAHLQHPYPTEDEKQELMRQTGLQMNQISNWFINARRRQLPTMINNARAESDARLTIGEEALHGNGHVEGMVAGPGSLGRSDGDGSAYGEYESSGWEQESQGPSKGESI